MLCGNEVLAFLGTRRADGEFESSESVELDSHSVLQVVRHLAYQCAEHSEYVRLGNRAAVADAYSQLAGADGAHVSCTGVPILVILTLRVVQLIHFVLD